MKVYGVEFEDVVTDDDGHQWSQLCERCKEKLNGRAHFIISNAPDNGICGVDQCENDADYYIDF